MLGVTLADISIGVDCGWVGGTKGGADTVGAAGELSQTQRVCGCKICVRLDARKAREMGRNDGY